MRNLDSNLISTSVILERDVSLSSSLVWNRQKDYYARRGAGVWSDDKIPTYMTSNPFIAESYAQIAAAFISDCRKANSKDRVRIIEFGAATGKFAYLFLKQLIPILESEGIPADSFCYCMTDCSHASIQTWKTNSYLSKYVETGHLSFELL